MSCGGCSKKTKAGAVAHGAAGLTKVALGVDRTSDEGIAFRRSECRVCDKATKREYKGEMIVTTLSRCTACHGGKVPCFIMAKIKIKSEECPEKKWNKEE